MPITTSAWPCAGWASSTRPSARCRAAIRLNPNHLDAQTNLGTVLQKQGRVPEGWPTFGSWCAGSGTCPGPERPGRALLASNEPAEAVVHFREAIRLQPAFAEAYGNLGLALRDLNRLDEAMACYREALRINPHYSLAHTNLGYAYKSLGKIDEAWAEFLETLRLEPNNAMALASLSKLAETGRHPLAPDHVHKLQALLERQDLLPDERCQLHYALASVFDRAGDHAAAFAHCSQANELRKEFVARRGIVYDPRSSTSSWTGSWRRSRRPISKVCIPSAFPAKCRSSLSACRAPAPRLPNRSSPAIRACSAPAS